MTADAASGLAITVELRDDAWRGALPRIRALCRRAARAAISAAGAPAGDAEISIVLGNDDLLRRLNREWRAVDAPTNVLAFPCDGPVAADAGPALLGDVVVSYETTVAEAARDGKTVADHLSHLIVHGTLHLLGHDHGTDEEAGAMEALERLVLGTLGIANPYAEPCLESAGRSG